MALYCAITKDILMGSYNSSRHYLYVLAFSNTKVSDEWEEWYVGKTTFNFNLSNATIEPSQDGRIALVTKKAVIDIIPYNNEEVILPDDCTGLFSGFMYWGIRDHSWVTLNNDCTRIDDNSQIKEIDLSKFNTSQVKNMTSMFEGSFSKPYSCVKGSSGFNVTLYIKRYVTLSGLEDWDLTNVNTMDRMFANINLADSTFIKSIPSTEYSFFKKEINWTPGCPDNKFSCKNMFAGSSLSLANGFNFKFNPNQPEGFEADFSNMFNNFCSGYFYAPSVDYASSTRHDWPGATVTSIYYTQPAGSTSMNVDGYGKQPKGWHHIPLNISNWSFSVHSKEYNYKYEFNSMFRNSFIEIIRIGNSFKNAWDNLKANSSMDYMFGQDSLANKPLYRYISEAIVGQEADARVSTPDGYTYSRSYKIPWNFENAYLYKITEFPLKQIQAEAGTDWSDADNVADGYRMFLNCTQLSNWDGTMTTERANNTKVKGYFIYMPPKHSINNYIKLASGWKESIVYLRTSEGWLESEVYI